MKTKWIAVVLILAFCCGLCLSGCQKTNEDVGYELYTYDVDNNRFVAVGCNLSFNEDNTAFVLNYLGTVQLFGDVSKSGMGYMLHINGDVYAQSQAALNVLTEEQKDALSEESYASWTSELSLNEQVYFYGDYVFNEQSVDLIRRVDGNKTTYTSIEGYYESANNTENIYLLRDGKVYVNIQDEDKKATFEDDGSPKMSKTPNATYVMKQGFIVFTRLDATGEVLLDASGKPRRVVYLLAGITYDADIADRVEGDDKDSAAKRALAQKLAGKTVGLLTKTFYSRQDLREYNFD